MRNGIPLAAVSELTAEIRRTPAEGIVRYRVGLDWQNGTRSTVRTLPMTFGQHQVNRDFGWTIDEPRQLGGGNHGPSPQEFLLAGVGACILVGFAVGAAVMGIQLGELRVEVDGELDLAGFLGVGPDASVPLRAVRYRIQVSGDGTPAQFEELRQQAVRHSPNAMSIAREVPLTGELQVN